METKYLPDLIQCIHCEERKPAREFERDAMNEVVPTLCHPCREELEQQIPQAEVDQFLAELEAIKPESVSTGEFLSSLVKVISIAGKLRLNGDKLQ